MATLPLAYNRTAEHWRRGILWEVFNGREIQRVDDAEHQPLRTDEDAAAIVLTFATMEIPEDGPFGSFRGWKDVQDDCRAAILEIAAGWA